MNLVFFDIDGTLANGRTVPESAKCGIQALRENGSFVWICTGRPLSYAKQYFSDYADGYVVYNGREGYTSTTQVFSHPLLKEEKQDIQRRLDEIDAGYSFFGNNKGYYFGPEEGYEPIANTFVGEIMKNTSVNDVDVLNLDIWYRDQEHYAKIVDALKDIAIVNPHGPYPTADVTILGKDKGTAIQDIAEYMQVPMDNVYAFGDGLNDISMFHVAGHTIAMGNGQEELKQIAEYITTDIDDDGVYLGLKHYNLI